MSRHQRRGEADLLTPLGGPEPGPRLQRLQHLLFEEVDRLFRLEVNDRRLQHVVPVALELSPDLRNAKVRYALRRGGDAAERAARDGLKAVTPFLRARVAEALSIKRTPDLHFHRDKVAEASFRAVELLENETPAGPPPASGPDEDRDA
jgi:ribosome-binding factor A